MTRFKIGTGASTCVAIALAWLGGTPGLANPDGSAGSESMATARPERGQRPASPGKARLCHFLPDGRAEILEISERSVPAHLAHGDVPAPTGIQSSDDCLIPHPPTGRYSGSGKTDSEGRARLLVPDSNVVVQVSTVDESGAPLPEMDITLLGTDAAYLLVSSDGALRYAPSLAEGNLSEAQPGSAPTERQTLLMRLFVRTFPGGGLVSSGNVTFPSFVRSHFRPSLECFTEGEFEKLLESECSNALQILTGVVGGQFQVMGWANVAGRFTAETVWGATLSSMGCPGLARSSASRSFEGKDLPLQLRLYHPPLLPGLKIFPVLFEAIDTCGGGCCVAQGPQCALASSSLRCSALGGRYSSGVPCTADPCTGGACCEPTGTCSQRTASECGSLGGTYQGNGTTCGTNPLSAPATFTMTSSRDLGGSSVVVPATGGTVKVEITVPDNMIRGAGTTGDCGRGDVRVEVRLCPPNQGCTGFTIYAGQGQGLDICHAFDQKLGPFEIRNSAKPCTRLSFNAITEEEAVARIEITP